MSSPGTGPSTGADLSCSGDACYWYQVGCQIGCPTCRLDLDHKGCGGAECCSKSEGLMEPTNNDPEFRTWDPHGQSKNPDLYKYNPWRAPGKAPVADPCGVASGGTDPGTYAAIPQGYKAGDKGSAVLPEQEATLWKAGATAWVGWGLSAQHAGGIPTVSAQRILQSLRHVSRAIRLPSQAQTPRFTLTMVRSQIRKFAQELMWHPMVHIGAPILSLCASRALRNIPFTAPRLQIVRWEPCLSLDSPSSRKAFSWLVARTASRSWMK